MAQVTEDVRGWSYEALTSLSGSTLINLIRNFRTAFAGFLPATGLISTAKSVWKHPCARRRQCHAEQFPNVSGCPTFHFPDFL